MIVALITGITGQDGSYLADLLIEKNYTIYGLIRRASSINTKRIDHIYGHPRLILRYGDLTDSGNLCGLLYEIEKNNPEMERLEVYNLAAMSHVKVSFEIPEYTAEVDGVGTLRLLEAIRTVGISKITRFYQASTSEMYGKVQEIPQNENTPFYPRSPYGVAKLYAYSITKNYREAYEMYTCNGILFNHESLAGFMPLIFRQNGIIDIKPISEIVKFHTLKNGILVDESKLAYQEGSVDTDLEVWDNNRWTKVKFASGYPHNPKKNNKKPKFIVSKNSAYFVTGDHVIIMDDDSEKKASDIELYDKVKLVKYPKKSIFINNNYNKKIYNDCFDKCKNKNLFLLLPLNSSETELLGLLVGNECISYSPKFTSKSSDLIDYVSKLWRKVCKRNGYDGQCKISDTVSGLNKTNNIKQLYLIGFGDFFKKYKIYNEDYTKRVPYQVLCSNKQIMLKFLEGYNKANGLKSNKCIYKFKNFKTYSACLAQGLLYLLHKTTDNGFYINVEFVEIHGCKRLYYSINIISNTKYYLSRIMEKYKKVTNHYNAIDSNDVTKIIEYDNYEGWFYDLETESGKFNAGIGLGRIHNSPRRGPTFLTRKVTIALGNILAGKQDKLVLGNLNAKRDWGHAKDFVYGMWLMLQQDIPDDYVLATGETHSVRKFVEKVFASRGFHIEWKGVGINEKGYDKKTGRLLIEVSDKYFRPSEVDLLLGDCSKAKKELEWTQKYSFDKLVEDMVDYDCPINSEIIEK